MTVLPDACMVLWYELSLLVVNIVFIELIAIYIVGD